MNRTPILIANGALLVLCCFLAARIIASLAAGLLVPAEAEASLSPRGADAAKEWSEREVILTRNLFNVSTLTPQGVAQVEEQYEHTKLNVKLLGTAAGANPAFSWAAVEDLDSRSHLVVRVGDLLKGRAEVLRIERKRLVLQNGPRKEELALEEDAPAAPRSAARRPPARRERPRPVARRRPPRAAGANVDVERLAQNRFALPRGDVEAAANNPAALFSQARILPKYENGEMVGVQLNAIKAGSLFEQIGIADGDTITEINGIQVTGQQESAQVLRELSESTQFNVTVTGADGEIRQLQYEVR